MINRLANSVHRDQRGITGLETAIILIAFVVVASVFAYTILSAGIFSAEKGKEAVYSGLETARSSMQLAGSVKGLAAVSVEVNDADSVWTAVAAFTTASGTVGTDTSDRKEGTASGTIGWDNTYNSGLMVTFDTSGTSPDLSGNYTIRFWLMTDTALAATDLEIVLDNTNTDCTTVAETILVPAITVTDTWAQYHIKMSDPSAVASVKCVGFNVGTTAPAATVALQFDLIEAPGEVDQIVILVTNSLEGEAVDLTPTVDTNTDGLLSDETKLHSMVVSYVGETEEVTDLTWTTINRGKGDGDNLLEPGEKIEITVLLKALTTLPVERTKFALYFRPAKGATLVIEKNVPSGKIDAVMLLY